MGHKVGQDAGAAAPARLDAEAAATIAETLQALATPSRLLILVELRRGARTVSQITAAVGMSQSAVSHQLRLLRTLGLVAATRDGRSISYRLFDHHVAELLDQALYHVEHLRMGAADRGEGSSAAAEGAPVPREGGGRRVGAVPPAP